MKWIALYAAVVFQVIGLLSPLQIATPQPPANTPRFSELGVMTTQYIALQRIVQQHRYVSSDSNHDGWVKQLEERVNMEKESFVNLLIVYGHEDSPGGAAIAGLPNDNETHIITCSEANDGDSCTCDGVAEGSELSCNILKGWCAITGGDYNGGTQFGTCSWD